MSLHIIIRNIIISNVIISVSNVILDTVFFLLYLFEEAIEF